MAGARAECANATWLFVVAAHVHNRVNCRLLNDTLQSIRRHHPGQTTLVVDNDSPFSNAESVASAIGAVVRHGTAPPSCLVVRRQRPSRGQLGSWQAADALLRAQQMRRIERVVVLQHSTPIRGSLQPMRLETAGPSCDATALMSGALVDPLNLPSKLDLRGKGMSWVQAVVKEMGIPATPPCTHDSAPMKATFRGDADARQQPTARLAPCLNWSVALHSVVMWSIHGWRHLARTRLWPADGANSSSLSLPVMRPFWASDWTASAASMQHAAAHADLLYNLGSLNVALERLTGILVAAINSRTAGASRPTSGHDLARCSMPERNRRIAKLHGETFKQGVAGERCA